MTFADQSQELIRWLTKLKEARCSSWNKTYKNYVVLAHLGVDTTTPVESAQFLPWLETLQKCTKLEGQKRVTVIDSHSHRKSYPTVKMWPTTRLVAICIISIRGGVTFRPTNFWVILSKSQLQQLKASPDSCSRNGQEDQGKIRCNAKVIVARVLWGLAGDRENVHVQKPIWKCGSRCLYKYSQTGFCNKTDLAVTNSGSLQETIAKDKPITRKCHHVCLLEAPFTNQGNRSEHLRICLPNLWTNPARKRLKPVLDENGQPFTRAKWRFLASLWCQSLLWHNSASREQSFASKSKTKKQLTWPLTWLRSNTWQPMTS